MLDRMVHVGWNCPSSSLINFTITKLVFFNLWKFLTWKTLVSFIKNLIVSKHMLCWLIYHPLKDIFHLTWCDPTSCRPNIFLTDLAVKQLKVLKAERNQLLGMTVMYILVFTYTSRDSEHKPVVLTWPHMFWTPVSHGF